MDVKDLIAQLRALVEGARSMPMSASAVVNRAELLGLIEQLESTLPSAFADQDKVVAGRDDVISKAHTDAAQILADAQVERERLVSETDVFRVAKHEADVEREAAGTEAEGLRRETDDYVDQRLATFEITLTKTLEAVTRGRARLQGRSHFDELGDGSGLAADYADGGLTTPPELRSDDPPAAG